VRRRVFACACVCFVGVAEEGGQRQQLHRCRLRRRYVGVCLHVRVCVVGKAEDRRPVAAAAQAQLAREVCWRVSARACVL
jgi:hypothetical protein